MEILIKIPGKNITYYNAFKKIVKPSKDNIFRLNLEWFNFPYSRQGWVSDKFIKYFGKIRAPGSKISTHHKNISSAAQKFLRIITLKFLSILII